MSDAPLIPLLRFGEVYESLDTADVPSAWGLPLAARAGLANAGLISKDLARAEAAGRRLREMSASARLDACHRAAALFANAPLPVLGIEGEREGPDAWLRRLSGTTGLPVALCRRYLERLQGILADTGQILDGLTRGLDLSLLDHGRGSSDGRDYRFTAETEVLAVVLPNNSPAVNALWLPAIALGIPVALKPGHLNPWTPLRLIAALVEAGLPKEAFGFYPTDHQGVSALLEGAGRSMLFGDARTTAPWVDDPRVELHGPGFSKVILTQDAAERWADHVDVIASSIAANGGRACTNASVVLTPANADLIGPAVAEQLNAIVTPTREVHDASLASFPNADLAQRINAVVERGLDAGGALDLTLATRGSPRLVTSDGGAYLRPTLVRCDRFDHPLVNQELLFPFATLVEQPGAATLKHMGRTLAVTVLGEDPGFTESLVRSTQVQRLNIGALPTSTVAWDQPHEGNLFDHLFRRRAIQVAPSSRRAEVSQVERIGAKPRTSSSLPPGALRDPQESQRRPRLQ